MNRLNSANKGFTLIEVLVALGVLALTIAGLGQVQQAAFRHIAVTQEIQQASYYAEVHLHRLDDEKRDRLGMQSGEYAREAGLDGYPWILNLELLSQEVFVPASIALSDKVVAVSADLSVWVDDGARELRFHTLLLREPVVAQRDFDQKNARPNLKLSN